MNATNLTVENLKAEQLTEAELDRVSAGDDDDPFKYAWKIGARGKCWVGPGKQDYVPIVVVDRKIEHKTFLFWDCSSIKYLVAMPDGSQQWVNPSALVSG